MGKDRCGRKRTSQDSPIIRSRPCATSYSFAAAGTSLTSSLDSMWIEQECDSFTYVGYSSSARRAQGRGSSGAGSDLRFGITGAVLGPHFADLPALAFYSGPYTLGCREAVRCLNLLLDLFPAQNIGLPNQEPVCAFFPHVRAQVPGRRQWDHLARFHDPKLPSFQASLVCFDSTSMQGLWNLYQGDDHGGETIDLAAAAVRTM